RAFSFLLSAIFVYRGYQVLQPVCARERLLAAQDLFSWPATALQQLSRLPFLVTSLRPPFFVLTTNPVRGRELPVASFDHAKSAAWSIYWCAFRFPLCYSPARARKR